MTQLCPVSKSNLAEVLGWPKEAPSRLLQKLNAFVLASDGLAASLPLFQGTERSPYGSRAFNNFCVGCKAR